MEDRKITLLKACRDLLRKQENSHYVLDLLYETVYYDEADCDGYCLLEDIEIELQQGCKSTDVSYIKKEICCLENLKC